MAYEIEVLISNGKVTYPCTYRVKNLAEEDLLIESLGHDLADGFFIDDVFYLKNKEIAK